MTLPAATGLRLAAVLLAASALQACANNPLAAIDGPYIPPSQRAAAAQAAAPAPADPDAFDTLAAPEAVTEPVAQAAIPAPDSPPASLPEPPVRPIAEQVPPEDLAWPDAEFVGPVLTAPEMAELGAATPAAPVAEDTPPDPVGTELPMVPPAFVALPESEPEPMPGGSPYSDLQAFECWSTSTRLAP
jgi:hypothetical protein